MRKTIFILLICISKMTFAQSNDDKSSWIIKWNSTAAIDIFTFPTIEFSIEKKISKI